MRLYTNNNKGGTQKKKKETKDLWFVWLEMKKWKYRK